MDANTRDVLTTAIQVGGGLVTGIVVAFLGLRHARALEADRAAREKAERWLGDRRRAYSRLLVEFDRHHHRIRDRINNPTDDVDEPTPGLLGSADRRMEQVRVVANRAPRAAAARLYGKLIVLDVLSRRPMQAWQVDAVEESSAELQELWTELYRAIHEDLGIPPDEPDEPGDAPSRD